MALLANSDTKLDKVLSAVLVWNEDYECPGMKSRHKSAGLAKLANCRPYLRIVVRLPNSGL